MGSPAAPYRLQFVPQAKAEWDALDGSSGFRLVYQVRDEALVLLAIAVGKRDKNGVYDAAQMRLDRSPKLNQRDS